MDSLTLEVTRGPLLGMRFTFTRRTELVLGRGLDCNLRFPDDEDHQTVSRHHCHLLVDPPRAYIRDMGSLNGTFLNDRLIGQRPDGRSPEGTTVDLHNEHEFKEGDELTMGNTFLTLKKSVPALCGTCRAAIPLQEVEDSRDEAGLPKCANCRGSAKQASSLGVSPPKKIRTGCIACGRGLSGSKAALPINDLLCTICQDDPFALVKGLVKQADWGDAGLASLRGMRILSGLGRGATGAAFLARHGVNKKQVALKILMPRFAASDWVRNSFLREVKNTGVLSHPNVVRLFESGNYKGIFFYTMEYCNGGSLDRVLLKRGGKLPLDEAAPLILQALDGLDYIHHAEIPDVKLDDGSMGNVRGLVHRDLKPANIFITETKETSIAKIADVGVGKAFDTAGMSGLTRTGTVAGSPATMPRQQVINFKYAKPDVDVWAMAASFYILLTGHFPRHFPDDEDPCLTVLQTKAVPIRERNSDVPAKLAEVIDRALIDNPEIVIKDAVELKQALTAAL